MATRASELRTKLESFSEKLQDIICSYHKDFKILREACKSEFDKLPAEAKQLLENSEWHVCIYSIPLFIINFKF